MERHQVERDILVEAIIAVKKGGSIRTTAINFGIPNSTVFRSWKKFGKHANNPALLREELVKVKWGKSKLLTITKKLFWKNLWLLMSI
jgi:hypothetical protein